MSTCRSCNARIIWAATRDDKRMPLDVEPVAGGNVELVNGVANVVSPNPQVRRYRSHFASCKSAAEHRKPKT